MIDGVHLVAEAIRAEEKAKAEAEGKTAKKNNVTKSEDDPVTAITGGKKTKKTKKADPEPDPEPETEDPAEDEDGEEDEDEKEE